MELAAPGIKKEYCRVAINDEGRSAEGRLQGKNLTIAIEKGGVHDVDNIDGGHQQEHKHEDKHHHYLRREFFASKATCGRAAPLFLFFFILFHPANPVSLFASLAPTGEILVHEGMESGIVAWFQEVA